MQHEELEAIARVYEKGYAAIQEVLDDEELTCREQLDEIESIVSDDSEDADSEVED